MSEKINPPPYRTVAQEARRLDVSEYIVRRSIKAGKTPAVVIQGRYLIPAAEHGQAQPTIKEAV
ncbi:MAG TPA: hypothetical protein VLZ74_11455 [Methylocella sp.]|nr:hypothetical protein [Methylocella sp.]